MFSRWLQPIPDTLPSPTKTTAAGASTISVKKKTGDTFLFGDEAVVATEDIGDDIAMDDVDDDWIVDDTGGQITDESRRNGERVKEMGKFN